MLIKIKFRDFLNSFFKPAVISLIFAVCAIIAGLLLPDEAKGYINAMLVEYLGGVTFSVWGVFLNNISVAAILFFGGFLLAIPTVGLGLLNFLILGAMFLRIAGEFGFLFFVAAVLPHGIFELPAIWLSMSLGVMLGARVLGIRYIGGDHSLLETFKSCVLFFLVIIVPLFFIAAVVEVYLTPYFIGMTGFAI